ncbi:hypothetical protein SAMN05216221_2322 [Pseudomonas oryzae]|uniref:Uncharacterized protein n=1 Tax=Pseudomonas oryzae TaxID=1392877 RepID=A0A1H1U180_9PSED|nr:hypothetical protein SAMN05216221_2322 [Pseudomonas oryzae]
MPGMLTITPAPLALAVDIHQPWLQLHYAN